MSEPTQPRPPSRLSGGLVGTGVAAYAFLDDLALGPILIGLTVWLPWYLTFGASAAGFSLLNIACNDWLERSWESWIQGNGAKLEARLEQKRRSRLLRRPLGWIARDSVVGITIAAGLVGALIIFALARLSSGKPVGRRAVVFGSVAYSVGFAATYTGMGVGVGDLIRAL